MKIAGSLLILSIAMFGAPVMAQTQESGTTDNSKPVSAEKAAATSPPDKKSDAPPRPKKVWTNDDVGKLKSSVSVVGDKNQTRSQASNQDEANDEDSDPHGAKVRQYRDAIEQLRTQIGEAETHIAQLKDFKADNGSPSGGVNPNRQYNMVPPEEQVKQLEARKKELEAKIEDLENQARKEGIDTGELR
jgi:hypothetical protein